MNERRAIEGNAAFAFAIACFQADNVLFQRVPLPVCREGKIERVERKPRHDNGHFLAQFGLFPRRVPINEQLISKGTASCGLCLGTPSPTLPPESSAAELYR